VLKQKGVKQKGIKQRLSVMPNGVQHEH